MICLNLTVFLGISTTLQRTDIYLVLDLVGSALFREMHVYLQMEDTLVKYLSLDHIE